MLEGGGRAARVGPGQAQDLAAGEWEANAAADLLARVTERQVLDVEAHRLLPAPA